MAFVADQPSGCIDQTLNALRVVPAGGGTGPTIVVTTPLTFSRGGTLLTPQSPINVVIWRAPFACTVTALKGFAVGATGTTVNARRGGVSTHLAVDLTLGSLNAWLDGGTVQNTAYAPGDELEIMLTGIGGNPSQIAVQVEYTRP